jgi:hypothetical protein
VQAHHHMVSDPPLSLLLSTVAGIIIRRLGGRWKSKADLLADFLIWEAG